MRCMLLLSSTWHTAGPHAHVAHRRTHRPRGTDPSSTWQIAVGISDGSSTWIDLLATDRLGAPTDTARVATLSLGSTAGALLGIGTADAHGGLILHATQADGLPSRDRDLPRRQIAISPVQIAISSVRTVISPADIVISRAEIAISL